MQLTREHVKRLIVENPADDGYRLVYADLCERDGLEDYAWFIRTQIQFHNLPCVVSNLLSDNAIGVGICHCLDLCSRCALFREAMSLAGREAPCYGKSVKELEWLDDTMFELASDRLHGFSLKKKLFDWEWRRGFITDVCAGLAVWQDHGPKLVASEPISSVTFDRLGKRLNGEGVGAYKAAYYRRDDDWTHFADCRDCLPDWLFSRLNPPQRASGVAIYEDLHDSYVDLSRAAIAWAKEF